MNLSSTKQHLRDQEKADTLINLREQETACATTKRADVQLSCTQTTVLVPHLLHGIGFPIHAQTDPEKHI